MMCSGTVISTDRARRPHRSTKVDRTLAVQTSPSAIEGLILSRDLALMPMHIGENGVNRVENPRSLCIRDRHCLDGERTIGARVLTDEPI